MGGAAAGAGAKVRGGDGEVHGGDHGLYAERLRDGRGRLPDEPGDRGGEAGVVGRELLRREARRAPLPQVRQGVVPGGDGAREARDAADGGGPLLQGHRDERGVVRHGDAGAEALPDGEHREAEGAGEARTAAEVGGRERTEALRQGRSGGERRGPGRRGRPGAHRDGGAGRRRGRPRAAGADAEGGRRRVSAALVRPRRGPLRPPQPVDAREPGDGVRVALRVELARLPHPDVGPGGGPVGDRETEAQEPQEGQGRRRRRRHQLRVAALRAGDPGPGARGALRRAAAVETRVLRELVLLDGGGEPAPDGHARNDGRARPREEPG